MFTLFFALFTLFTATAATPVDPNVMYPVVFVRWDVDHPTVTLVSGLDPEQGKWTRIHVLDDGDGVRESGKMWRFNVPEELVADFDEIVVYTDGSKRVETLTLFEHARVTVPLISQPEKIGLVGWRFLPFEGGQGDPYLSTFAVANIDCEGTACNTPYLFKQPRLMR